MAVGSPGAGDRASPAPQQVTPEAGRYLLELFWAVKDDERVGTGTVSDRLGVTEPSATEMLGKLGDDGFVDHEKYDGTRPTDHGREVAAALAWRYCIVADFFRETLDAPVDDATAYEIGVRLPPEAATALGEKVGLPCQHACPCLDDERPRPVETA